MAFTGNDSARTILMTNVDIHHNLTMNNSHRNPLMRTKSTRIVNNLHYNLRSNANQVNGGGLFDIIGNKYKRGPVNPNAPWHEIGAFAGNARSAPGVPVYVHERESGMASSQLGWRPVDLMACASVR